MCRALELPCVWHREGGFRPRTPDRFLPTLPLHLPVLVRDGAQVAFGGLDGGAVHRIKIVLAGGRVAPEEVALAVSVKVANARDLPRRIGDGAQIALGWLDRSSRHRIEIVLSRDDVSPQNVVLAVAVEVSDARDLPALVGHGADKTLSDDRSALQQIKIILSSRHVAPQNVSEAVGVDVAESTAQNVRSQRKC